MEPANLAAQLAAAKTELACLRLMLAEVKEGPRRAAAGAGQLAQGGRDALRRDAHRHE
jgi:hypothetical protein